MLPRRRFAARPFWWRTQRVDDGRHGMDQEREREQERERVYGHVPPWRAGQRLRKRLNLFRAKRVSLLTRPSHARPSHAMAGRASLGQVQYPDQYGIWRIYIPNTINAVPLLFCSVCPKVWPQIELLLINNSETPLSGQVLLIWLAPPS